MEIVRANLISCILQCYTRKFMSEELLVLYDPAAKVQWLKQFPYSAIGPGLTSTKVFLSLVIRWQGKTENQQCS